jgi:hypothetical protein
MGALSIDDFSGNADPDLDQPDLALFESLERAIKYAHQRGAAPTSGPGEMTIGNKRPIIWATDSAARAIDDSSATSPLAWARCPVGV